jgi:glycine/D-amino acid oxidase-like deaminating enzyme
VTTEPTASVLWEAELPPRAPASGEGLPRRVDVAVIGGGYTGLCAARALRQAGASVLVLERDRIGAGASSRNGGFVLPGYKSDIGDIVRRFGLPLARQLHEDSLAAIAFVERLVADEGISCDFHRPGYVTLAAKPRHLDGLEETRRLLERDFGYHSRLLSQTEMKAEIATAVRRVGQEFELETSRGPVTARDMLVATNGYTGNLLPWLAQRVVPVGSFLIATAPLSTDQQRRLIPHRRLFADTKNLLYYFRLSADGRMVFGGRAAFVPSAVERSRELLRLGMAEVFPELDATPVAFAWGGALGFTRDLLPHAGRHDGVAYALGYGGHGVALASWLGDRVGRAMAGVGAWPAIASTPFPSIPLYRGTPWFLPVAGAYYALKDRLD